MSSPGVGIWHPQDELGRPTAEVFSSTTDKPLLLYPCCAHPYCLLVQAFGILQEELGRPIAEVFSSISDKPIAAASLGQVYKAVLRETSEAVAVKVQRPSVEPVIFRDLFIFRAFARLING